MLSFKFTMMVSLITLPLDADDSSISSTAHPQPTTIVAVNF